MNPTIPEQICFIVQTAKDYDMEYEEVEKIYNECKDSRYITKIKAVKFYEMLEEFINERSKNH